MSRGRESIRAKIVSTFTSKGRYPSQEDSLLADREKGIFVVADGFGGQGPGAQASKTACEAIRSFLFKEAGDLEATLPFVLRSYFSLAGNVLFNSLIYANRKLSFLNREKNVHERGGASVIAGFIDGELLAIANVGVCTAWLIRDGKPVELVVPRSYGKLRDPYSSEVREEWKIPLIALGIAEDLEPEIFEYRIQSKDWLIFATDGIGSGLWQKIFEILKKNQDSEAAIQTIQTICSQSEFQDNAAMTIVAI